MSFAGWRTLWWSLSTSVATSTVPLGMWKALMDCRPVGMKAFLHLSFVVPMLEVAPVSTTAEGMEPSRTPAFSCCSVMLLACS